MKKYRQGDVLLLEIDKLPYEVLEHIQESSFGENILVKGEATGHDHSVVNGVFYRGSSTKSSLIVGFLLAHEGCKIIHPEHNTILLPKGNYEVRRQRELWNGQERRVSD